MADHIFISHSTKDDAFVTELRQALNLRGLTVWVDSRNLRGGDRLRPEIQQAIREARTFLVVVSESAFDSTWVYNEIKYALEIQAERDKAYRVIPLLLGVSPARLRWLFGEDVPLAVNIKEGPGALEAAMTDLLAALGERLPTNAGPHEAVAAHPVAELLLRLTHPHIVEEAGTRRAAAEAQLIYRPADRGERRVESDRFLFKAPLGPIEAEELRWYLKKYHHWPIGQVYQERAAKVEASLPAWGQSLYQAVAEKRSVQEALRPWETVPKGVDRRFSIFVDSRLLKGSPEEQQAEANEAATTLLGLPWELLHDGRRYLFRGARPVLVRRRLPSQRYFPRLIAQPPIRVLLVSPRPEGEEVGWIDHRVIARPMTEALGDLAELAELTVLAPPTFPALQAALQEAEERGEPFHVVHFDGHGVFDKRLGLGGLCFEDPQDVDKLSERRHQTVDAREIAAVIRERRIPLVFLNACQSAQAEEDPTASVAARLLDEGVASVVAMSYTVLVETARRFVTAFYQALVGGARVGQAMLRSQQALQSDTFRMKVFGGNDLHLQDWFVPVLFQEEEDLQLFRQVPSERIAQVIRQERRLRLGQLPQKEDFQFVGRSRELLALERMLADQPWAVVVGQGGEGKTTLAVELAQWRVQSQRYQRAAFINLEEVQDARAAVDALGRQLVPKYSVAEYPADQLLKQALQPIQRILEDEPTVVVVDSVESVLADPWGFGNPKGLGGLFTRLLETDPHTRLVFTSREDLPEPFAPDKRRYLRLGRLSREDAIKLVEQHMPAPPPPDDATRIEELVEAVQGHARSLVLLAPEISQRGVMVTTAALSRLMAELHAAYPEDRERSLFASVELSLGRLTPEIRQRIRPLGVFQGEVDLDVLAMMMGMEKGELAPMVGALLQTNLAELMPYDHLRLHPALGPYLAQELTAEETAHLTARWAEGMVQLTEFLYRQWFEDTKLSVTLTRLELSNLLYLLEYLAERADPETTLAVANNVEELLARLDHPRLLKRVVAVREQASGQLGDGLTGARFTARRMEIERLLQAGQVRQAHQAGQQLLADSQGPGSQVSAYNQALAFLLLGRVLEIGGAAAEALIHIREAQRRFEQLGEKGARMTSAALTEQGDCLVDLGRLEEAAQAYEESTKRAETLQDTRQVAVGKIQLATVRLEQRRYAEALAGYQSARRIFAELGEPQSVAAAWHQIGRVHEEAGDYEAAEEAYREALALKVKLKDRAGEARTLGQLSSLYDKMGRLEDSVSFLRQAADIFVQFEDLANEGRARNTWRSGSSSWDATMKPAPKSGGPLNVTSRMVMLLNRGKRGAFCTTWSGRWATRPRRKRPGPRRGGSSWPIGGTAERTTPQAGGCVLIFCGPYKPGKGRRWSPGCSSWRRTPNGVRHSRHWCLPCKPYCAAPAIRPWRRTRPSIMTMRQRCSCCWKRWGRSDATPISFAEGLLTEAEGLVGRSAPINNVTFAKTQQRIQKSTN
jgi:tetratricopeptide (TPR) repeat protein